MIIHVALFKWKPGVRAKAVQQAMSDVRALKYKVDGIVDIRCGKNFSPWNEGFTHALVVLAQNKAALEAYRNHPDHKVIAKNIEAMDGGSIGIDIED